MFKRLLGIKKLESGLSTINKSLSRSWQWISHFNNLNSSYENRLNALESSQNKILELLNSVIESEDKESPKEERYVEQPFVSASSEPENTPVRITGKTSTIIQIIYGYAAFSYDNAITTNKIAEHITFKITERGLRKKLNSLVETGFLKTVKKGNTRFWYLNSDKLIRIKKLLAEQ